MKKTKYEIYLACIIFCVADNVQAALYVVVFFNKVSIIEWSYKRFFKFPWFSEWKLLKLYVCQALQFTTILPTAISNLLKKIYFHFQDRLQGGYVKTALSYRVTIKGWICIDDCYTVYGIFTVCSPIFLIPL